MKTGTAPDTGRPAFAQNPVRAAPMVAIMTRYRWTVCALLFAATTINYMDRQVIGILKPYLQKDLGWSEIGYGHIVFFFQLAYAMGYAGVGRLIDRLGVRFGLAGVVTFWSLAAVPHGLVVSVPGFSRARFALGLGEGGNFPAAIKTVGEWFPQKDRALVTGLFNSGSNVGALLTPLLVPWLTLHYGWHAAFYVTGTLGFFWVVAWLLLYRPLAGNTHVSEAERAYIRSDSPASASGPRETWLELLRHRATWAFVVGTFLTSPVWWFYLFWVPDFLHRTHGLNLSAMGAPLVTIYLITDIGS